MSTRSLSFFILVACWTACVACSSRATIVTGIDAGRGDGSAPVDGPRVDAGPTACTTSRQCPNQVCSSVLGACVDCNTSVDCTGGQICRASRCVAPPTPCTSSRQCSGMGQVCDGTLGVCVQCVLDTDCMPGQFCSSSQTCQMQVCVPGRTSCTNAATLQTCGTHGDGYTMSSCPGGQVCSGASCMATVCTPGTTSCANMTTVNTCNATGLGYSATPCPATNSCNAGVCMPWTCTPNAMTCGSSSEVSVCSADGLTSTVIPCMAMDSCCAGACTGWICMPGAMSCASSTMVQVCNTDGLTYTTLTCPVPANAMTSTCASNTCGFTCRAGYGNCDGVAMNGCEATLAADASNCGSCGHACAAPANALASCVSSTCGFACTAGDADCDHLASNGCESPSATDANNCGSCGHACATGQVCAAGVCGAPTYRQTVLADGPIAYWPLDEVSGTLVADIVGGHNGTVVGMTTLATPPLIGGGTSETFTGSGYIQVPYASALNTPRFSVEMWARVDGGDGTYRSPFTTRTPSVTAIFQGLALYADNGNLWDVFTGSPSATGSWIETYSSTSAEVIGTVYHLASTYDGTAVRLYVNGAQVAQTTVAYDTNPDGPLRIGSGMDTGGVSDFLFLGAIDEVALFNVALPAARIAAHAAARH